MLRVYVGTTSVANAVFISFWLQKRRRQQQQTNVGATLYFCWRSVIFHVGAMLYFTLIQRYILC